MTYNGAYKVEDAANLIADAKGTARTFKANVYILEKESGVFTYSN